MSEIEEEPLSLSDEDRLPWLEAVEDDSTPTVGLGKLMAFLVTTLAALGVVIGGVWWLKHRATAPQGDGRTITADGNYKSKPDAPGGMHVEGQGDETFAASEGAEANGRIDVSNTTEAPVTKPGNATATPEPAPATKPTKVATAPVPATAAPLVATPPVAHTAKPAKAAPGSLIQLGAYGSEAKANEGWVGLTRRYAYLASLTKVVESAEVNGSTVFRLRANAGDAAETTCSKLKASGENCMVVN